jgi:hypothetical protein
VQLFHGRGNRRHIALGLRIHGRQRSLGVVEHVPGIGAPRLQRLHVVLDADDGIGQPVQGLRCKTRAALLHHGPEMANDAPDTLHRSRLAQHHKARLDALHQVQPVVEPGGIKRAADVLRDVFLDAREIDHALAQYGRLHVLEIDVHCGFTWRARARQDHADQFVIKAVLHLDERSGNVDQR